MTLFCEKFICLVKSLAAWSQRPKDMTLLCEDNLQITIPSKARARKFDEGEEHGLTQCMKAVDFIIEKDDQLLFVEFKDPDNPSATERKKEEFLEKINDGKLVEDLVRKCRDTFLYEWGYKRTEGKRIHYLVLIEFEQIDKAVLLALYDDLKRKLPLKGPPKKPWPRPFVRECALMSSLKTWNERFPELPVERIPKPSSPASANGSGTSATPSSTASSKGRKSGTRSPAMK